ncbi:hypothetical protein imdm_841 [gamma proteobacterium IMCC2047]|nr:hypothetical protein imdm_841 [gamma proteobacterium IMCC2047]
MTQLCCQLKATSTATYNHDCLHELSLKVNSALYNKFIALTDHTSE